MSPIHEGRREPTPVEVADADLRRCARKWLKAYQAYIAALRQPVARVGQRTIEASLDTFLAAELRLAEAVRRIA